MSLVIKVHGKAKPVFTLSLAAADLNEGDSVQADLLRNGVLGGTIAAVSSSDPRFTITGVGTGTAHITFVGPADPNVDIAADLSVTPAS